MLILLGLLCLSLIIIVLLFKKMKSMRERFELRIAQEKKNSEMQISETRQSADIAIASARKNAEEKVEEAHKKAEQQIRDCKEYIESQREVLMGRDEKILMVDTMMALGSLSERLTYTEKNIERVAIKLLDFLATDSTFKTESLESIQNLREDIDSIKSDMHDVSWEASGMKAKLDSIYDATDVIKSETNDVFWGTRDIKSKIDSVQVTVNDIKSETNSIYYKIN